MTLLNPRRHVAVHFGTAPPLLVPESLAPAPAPARRYPAGWRVEANAGGSVLLLPTATRAELLELRGWVDAALAAAEAG